MEGGREGGSIKGLTCGLIARRSTTGTDGGQLLVLKNAGHRQCHHLHAHRHHPHRVKL